MIYSQSATTMPIPRVRSELEEFDMSSAVLENLLILEEAFFEITRNHMTATHIATKDGNVEILQEGFGDFMKSAVEFFKNMVQKFKDFFAKVWMYIQAYMGNFDKFFEKYKDRLKEVEPDFYIKGHKFSFTPDVPRLDKVQNVIHTYNAELDGLDKLTKADIVKEREEFTSSSYLGRMRGHVIGANSGIDSEDFVKDCKKVYRSGDEEPMDIHVNKNYLNDLSSEYANLKNTLKDCTRERDRVIMLIESMKDFFLKSGSVHYKGTEKKVIYTHGISVNDNSSGITRTDKFENDYTEKTMDTINVFFNFKWTQSKEIGFVAVTAMTEKVTALKDALKQHQNVLRRCILTNKQKPESGESK